MTNIKANEALIDAAKDADIEAMKAALEAGADVNHRNGKALIEACEILGREESKALAMVKLLIESGANPNLRACYRPYTALEQAASSGFVEVVKLLIANGAIADSDALEAGINESQELVKALLEAGAVINSCVLWNAAKYGNVEMLKFLGSQGADVAAASKEQDLIRAAIMGSDSMGLSVSPELIQLLIDLGANVNRRDQLESSDPLLRYAVAQYAEKMSFLQKYCREDQVEDYRNRFFGILECLINAGVDINAASETWGETALMEAAAIGEPAIVKMLIEAGADVNAESKLGKKAQPKASCTQPQKKEIQDMLKEARAAVRAAAKAAAKEAAAASGEPKAAPKKACAAKSTAKKTNGTKSTTTKKTTAKKKAE